MHHFLTKSHGHWSPRYITFLLLLFFFGKTLCCQNLQHMCCESDEDVFCGVFLYHPFVVLNCSALRSQGHRFEEQKNKRWQRAQKMVTAIKAADRRMRCEKVWVRLGVRFLKVNQKVPVTGTVMEEEVSNLPAKHSRQQLWTAWTVIQLHMCF